MRLRVIAARSAALSLDRSVPFGMCWRNRPLVLSLEGRCRGCGDRRMDLDAGGDRELGLAGHLLALVRR